MNSPCILIMAGGTGGHVFPALAVANELRERGWDVQWLGTQKGIEARIVPAAKFPLNTIQVEGLRGKGLISLLIAPFKLVRSLFQAFSVVRAIRPQLVIGFGGFASGPGGFVAKIMGIPLIIHEQNARAGTTNRMLSKIANRTLEAFSSGLAGAERVGNPVRAEICNVPVPEQRFANRVGALRILVLGGSLGAQYINDLVPKAVALLDSDQISVRHQAGDKHVVQCVQAYEALGLVNNVSVCSFIEDMAEAYSWADIVVCRAGALTVSEISAVGLAALFVPFPYAIDDHQTANATWLAEAGAGWVKQQYELTPTILASFLEQHLDSRSRLLSMAKMARAQSLPDSVAVVANICQEVVGG